MRDMRSFCLGLALRLMQQQIATSVPQDPEEVAAYEFDPDTQTLILNSDDGSLSFGFSTDTFQMDVEEV